MDRTKASLTVLVLLALALALSSGGKWPVVVAPSHATAATYVYEKDDGGVPGFVGAALDKLNRREPPILATPFEEDTTDATGETPEQYKPAVTAARAIGLPSLVIQAGDKVLKAVKDPKAEDFEAIK